MLLSIGTMVSHTQSECGLPQRGHSVSGSAVSSGASVIITGIYEVHRRHSTPAAPRRSVWRVSSAAFAMADLRGRRGSHLAAASARQLSFAYRIAKQGENQMTPPMSAPAIKIVKS